MSTPTPRTDANEREGLIRGCATPTKVVRSDFARQLERDIFELNERLIDRQKTLMAALTENQNLKRELAKANQ
jgi:hypothetical protein